MKKKAPSEDTHGMLSFIIENMMTKDDAKEFATKEDLKSFATKEDLNRFATKDDIAELNNRMRNLERSNDEILDTLRPCPAHRMPTRSRSSITSVAS